MRRKTLVFLGVIGATLVVASSFSAVPRLINYQGVLNDSAGTEVNATVSMTFSIYGDSIGGSAIWTETHAGVDVQGGLFQVFLGEVAPLPLDLFSTSALWISIQVATDSEMVPRMRMASVAWAMRAAVADSVVGGSSGGAGDGHSLDAVDGNPVDAVYVDSIGNVGIGTTTPTNILSLRPSSGVATIGMATSDGFDGHRLTITGGGGPGPGRGAYIEMLGNDYWFNPGRMEIRTGTGNAGDSTFIVFASGGDAYNMMLRSNGALAIGHGYMFDKNIPNNGLVVQGDVGIGTRQPSEKLEVAGTAQVQGFKMPTSASAGRVLTSDGSGVGTWQPASGGGGDDGDWTVTGDSMHAAVSGNVGIGTSTPAEKLHVVGDTRLDGLLHTSSVKSDTTLRLDVDLFGDVETLVLRNGTVVPTRFSLVGNSGGVPKWRYEALEFVNEDADGFASIGYHHHDYSHEPDYPGALVINNAHPFEDDWIILECDGNRAMVLDESGNVGIGIGSLYPSAKLQVAGTIHSTTGGVKFPDGSTQTTAAAASGWQDDGSVVRLDIGTDSVGIGTTLPQEQLHVTDNVRIDGAVLTELVEGNGGFQVNTSGSPRMTIQELFGYGRVGVGTTSPGGALHVVHDNGIFDPLFIFENPSTSPGSELRFRLVDEDGVVQFVVHDDAHGTRPNGLTIENDKSGGDIDLIPDSGNGNVDVEGTFRINDSGGNLYARIQSASGAGVMTTYGPSGNRNAALTAVGSNPDHGFIAVYDALDQKQAQMYVDAAGNGIVAADIKSFRTPHPSQPQNEIWYASLEGPEAAAYVRGTATLVDGTATITLPGHFTAIAVEAGMTVQVTPLSAESKGLAVTEKHVDRIVVRELAGGAGNYDFDFVVTAVRKGHEGFRVVRTKANTTRPVTE